MQIKVEEGSDEGEDGGSKRREEKRRIVNIKEVTRLNDRKGQLFKKDAKLNAWKVVAERRQCDPKAPRQLMDYIRLYSWEI